MILTDKPCPWCGNIAPGENSDFCYKNPDGHKNWLAAKKSNLDREKNVITSISELNGWEIMEVRRHKPGVVKWAAERNGLILGGRVRREGYAKDEVFARLQIQPPL